MRVNRRGFSEAFGAFVQQRRAATGQTQLQYAARLGISASHLAEIEAGVIPPLNRVDRMAQKAGEDPTEWLAVANLEGEAAPPSNPGSAQTATLPVQAEVHGGGLLYMLGEEQVRDFHCFVEQSMADSRLIVKGDAAYPAFAAGDLVAIQKATKASPGDIVLVEGPEDQKTLVRYLGHRQGHPTFCRLNKLYPPIEEEARIIGVATWLFRGASGIRDFGR